MGAGLSSPERPARRMLLESLGKIEHAPAAGGSKLI